VFKGLWNVFAHRAPQVQPAILPIANCIQPLGVMCGAFAVKMAQKHLH